MHKSARTDLSRMAFKGSKKTSKIDILNETNKDKDDEHYGIDTAGDDVVSNHSKLMKPGDTDVNVMAIKTRDFRYNSVKKVDAKNKVGVHQEENDELP